MGIVKAAEREMVKVMERGLAWGRAMEEWDRRREIELLEILLWMMTEMRSPCTDDNFR